MKKAPRVIPDRNPLALALVSPKVYRSAIDSRTADDNERRAKRLAQATVFKTLGTEVPPFFWPSQNDNLVHSSLLAALSKLYDVPAVYPAAPALGPAEQTIVTNLEEAIKRSERIASIDVDPTRSLDAHGLQLLFDPSSLINDDFLDTYLATMDLLHRTDSRNFFFISFLESAESAVQTIILRHFANANSPLTRFFLNEDATLYGAFNVGGCHWIAFKWDRTGLGKVTVMDSYSPVDFLEYPWKSRPAYIGDALNRFRELGNLPEPERVAMIKVPRQTDGVSCGLYALLNIRKLALGIDYQSARVPDYRRYLLAEIITQRIPLAPSAEAPMAPPVINRR